VLGSVGALRWFCGRQTLSLLISTLFYLFNLFE
jgi:hypothetical protein